MANNMAKEVSGKLSSRVMNMKFMRHAEQAEEEQRVEVEQRKFIDSSEWSIPGRRERLRQIPTPRPVVAVGHTVIRTIDAQGGQASATPGRRKFGSTPVEAADASGSETHTASTAEPKAEDLETLWKSEKRTKRPKTGAAERPGGVKKRNRQGAKN
ncbi:AAR056Cp [Eremothecium gossypii ATCC 10895]|uniref:AAR056Cp n=1 Tax=Eremothecium gossypii (strain ATCC 10895 / CBS 109.51 / FGSC 9923 / NRRL Y-1056) TaxID=284811 RepID=Q75EM3_EREGS|nr:AAR056Cp [Eremothecium gossypii ATCC 10895]AAS50421.1 AAR056Cp [Eremothecium gossypii ATCC 10895]AEY94707.1 FAAR056Cp [Eremothecium gossypii FDAG1]